MNITLVYAGSIDDPYSGAFLDKTGKEFQFTPERLDKKRIAFDRYLVDLL